MIEEKIAQTIQELLSELYELEIVIEKSQIQRTKKEYDGDFTFVVFPFTKATKRSPDILANELGEGILKKMTDNVVTYSVIKGFLNISISDIYWIDILNERLKNTTFSIHSSPDKQKTLIEYSSPNTNKPLHLGHVRNNLLGHAVANILEACGKDVTRVNLVNDRGIHICKSMLAWQKYGQNETPESTGMKGDHLVGKYYVEFDKYLKGEINALMQTGISEDNATKQAPLMVEAQEMLQKWEKNEPDVRNLWKKMNQWVYDGFQETYRRMGISFDKIYYESETYLLGKQIVEEGLSTGQFYQKDDNSIWVNLTEQGLDEKLLLRSDGTSVYMTQDLGTVQLRFEEYSPQEIIYVVGNEQNYHFDVLKLILTQKLHKPYGDAIFHLSYGMVELPQGKMKSREGTVIDADDLMEEMFVQAKSNTEALGKFHFEEQEANRLYEMIGMGALKYFILKVDPKKNMLFNPDESIDFNGNTAPFIQYTHARIKSLLRKATELDIDMEVAIPAICLSSIEKDIIRLIYEYPQIVLSAGEAYSPALIANFIYELAKSFNHLYQEIAILKEENASLRLLRLQISRASAVVIKHGMGLLGIEVPERM